jgi:hypothetical protein
LLGVENSFLEDGKALGTREELLIISGLGRRRNRKYGVKNLELNLNIMI